MGNDRSRRQFLGAGLALGIGSWFSGWARSPVDRGNELRVESDGSGVAAYEFTVSGSLRQVDDGDQVDGNRARGHVGPDRGTDNFEYSGEITGFVLAGPAAVFRNGARIRLGGFPHPEGSLTSANVDTDSGTNVLRIESDGGGVAAYELAVTESIGQRDGGDQVEDDRAWGHVGPDRGTDEFEFTGEVTRFELAGPASVFLNGSAVTPGSSGADRGVIPASPDREVTAVPETTLLFEAVAPDRANEFLRTDWYVDGREYVSPGAFHGQFGGRGRAATTCRFDAEGSHEVRADVYERASSGERGERVGTAEWTVHVGPDGNRPPAVELVAPDEPIPASRDSPERRTFEVSVSDPEGALDRAVWWESQCDYVLAISDVDGASDDAKLSHAPNTGCPLAVRAIDRDGAVSDLRGWSYERTD